ncbi:MAG: class I SAM-dependent rRNA methyltransferase [Tannerella sp.]|jgi:23S rRNA (cytosine1962-C5)-methyltransferase|nr:class I SAM-dependent rRNA methyltransferase [Tannerella sp.]
MNLCKIYLKPKKEESLLRFHPWVFSGAVGSVDGKPAEGDLVEVYSANNHFLGIGHYQIGSIVVRILSFTPAEIDIAFWTERIRQAYKLRRSIGLIRTGTNDPLQLSNSPVNDTYRLIHGEGDCLPGLIIDIYASTAVIQAHSVGMHYARKDIAIALCEVLGSNLHRIYYKSEGTLPFKADLGEENEYLYGGDNKESSIAVENGIQFHIDWQKGQKTGFFIDQRDNRTLLQHYAKDCAVLNMFCYTGGFSVYALRGGASLVHSVDSSAKAIALTNENVALNFPEDVRHQAFAEDAFKFMESIDDKYDLIVLDPPAFAKHRNVLRNALQGYRKLNAIAFKKIKPGGIIFTFSCSQIVSKNDFRLTVFSAAAQSGRTVRILHQLTQPADHPINIYHPEGEYLKGLVLQVE